MIAEGYSHVTQLGHDARQLVNPDAVRPEHIAKPALGRLRVIRLTCPEFTSNRSITAQPDVTRLLLGETLSGGIVKGLFGRVL